MHALLRSGFWPILAVTLSFTTMLGAGLAFDPGGLFAEETGWEEMEADGWGEGGPSGEWPCTEEMMEEEWCACEAMALAKYNKTCQSCRKNDCDFDPGWYCYLSCTCYNCTGGN